MLKHRVFEIFAFLGFYVELVCSSFLTFRDNILVHLQGSSSLTRMTLEDMTSCPEMSVMNYQPTLRKVPKEWRSPLYCDWRLKSCKRFILTFGISIESVLSTQGVNRLKNSLFCKQNETCATGTFLYVCSIHLKIFISEYRYMEIYLHLKLCNRWSIFSVVLKLWWGTRCLSCLRHCVTSRKVSGSIPDGIFLWYDPSSRTMPWG